MPDTRPYTQARRAARRQMLALDADTQARIRRVMDDYIARLTAALRDLPPDRQAAIAASRDVTRFLTRRMEEALIALGEDRRTLSFQQTRDLWQEAVNRIATIHDVPDALLGAVRVPPLTMLGAFEAMGTDRDWKSLMRGHTRRAAEEVQTIIADGIADGRGSREVARQLRQYVQGAEPLAAYVGADGKIDLRTVPPDLRGAARQMAFNADRLAITEIHAARHEAEVQHQITDPFVEANRWTLSPDRGSARVPDGCDYLAAADYYGLGRGIFPVYATPSMVHPFDRCELIPVPRPLADIAKEKPAPGRRTSPFDVRIPGDDSLTETGLRRARQDAIKAIVTGEGAIQSRLRGRAAA